MAEQTQTISVEVAFALPDKQTILTVQVPEGATALEAAKQSGITGMYEEIDLDNAKMGIFSKPVTPQQVLREGDRVEIYRPLIADPKEVRKARAARAKERRESESKKEA